MKLLGSTRSPYVRKVLVAAHEVGLADQIEMVAKVVTLVDREPDVCAANPLGQVPALLLPNSQTLYDSGVICDYLDAISTRPHLIPDDRMAKVEMSRRHAEADGLLAGFVRWYSERRRTDEPLSSLYVSVSRDKLAHVADHWDRQAYSWAERPIDLGFIAIGCALAYGDFRFSPEDWRSGRPALAGWYDIISTRPSFVATAFRVDG